MRQLVQSVGILKGKIPPLREYGFRILSNDFLAILVKGEAVYEDNVSGRFRVTEGNVVLSPSGWPHRYDPDRSKSWENYWMVFDQRATAEYFGDLLPVKSGVFRIQTTESLKEAWRDLNDIYLYQRNILPVYGNFLLHQILIQIYIQTNQVQVKKTHPVIEDAIQLMMSNVGKRQIDFGKLAAKASMSYHSFRLLFRKETGSAPKQYFLRLKMNMAQSMLADTVHNISEISETLGFEDPYYFSRLFKNKNGMSPRKYRETFIQRWK